MPKAEDVEYTRLVVEVPIEVKDELQIAAVRQDLTTTQLVRRILTNAIEVDKERGE